MYTKAYYKELVTCIYPTPACEQDVTQGQV